MEVLPMKFKDNPYYHIQWWLWAVAAALFVWGAQGCSAMDMTNIILLHATRNTPAPGIPDKAWFFCYDQIDAQFRNFDVRNRMTRQKEMCLRTRLMESCETFLYSSGFMWRILGDQQEEVNMRDFQDWAELYSDDCLKKGLWDSEMEQIRRSFEDAMQADLRVVCP
jgi:hypothetical protein